MHKFLKLLFLSLLACSVFLTGCGSSVPIVKPFKMDIQQGNVVTSKMLLQLKPGMTKSQVKFIMGTPLIVDSFHSNRWDYFYQMRQAGKIKEQRRVILDFENELLTRVRGDVVPEGTAGAASGTEAGAVTLPKSIEPKPKEEGLLDKLKFWKKDEKKPEVKPAAKPELKEVAPIEPPKTEAPGTDVSEPTGDTPSILVVPIGGVAPSVPEANVPEVTAPVVEEPEVEAPKVKTPKVVSPKKVEPVNAELPKAAPIKSAEPAPAPSKPAATEPAATKEDPYILRIDRNLDANNLETAPIESVPTAKPKKADVPPPPPPPEEEPGYFEKMLEKIGF